MANELLEFTGKKDFEDLQFGKGYNLTEDDITAFKADCMRINNTHNKMVLEQCKVGLLLDELREGKVWKSVINKESGYAYLIHSFEDFCKDVFGFSKSKTYALLQISKFTMTNSQNEVHFINEKYSEFSTSQLTELASVPSGQRHYFTKDMTIEQMRLLKKYIASNEFWNDRQKEDFDLLTYANNYAESKKTPKALPTSNPDILDGKEEIFPTSGKIERGEEVDEVEEIAEEIEQNACVLIGYGDDCEPAEGEVWQGGGIDRDTDEYDELDETQEDMQAEMATIEEDAEKSLPAEEVPSVDLSTNAKIREFLHGYDKWGRRFSAYPLEFMSVYYHSFRNGRAILAVLSPCCSDMEQMKTDHFTVRYYWKNEPNGTFFEVTTRELERVIPLIKDEL